MIKIVIGGQFGSEGKGEVCAWLASQEQFDLVIRIASPNSGHTFTCDARKYIMRQLPCTWKAQDAPIYLPSGSIINAEVLAKEIQLLRNSGCKSPIVVSPYASVVDPTDIGISTCLTGTTYEGVGETRAKRCLRQVKQHKYESRFYPTVQRMLADPRTHVLIESSQGYGLSSHSRFYPYCTSTDINPYQILQDADVPFGLHQVEVWMVIRTHPIRIAGKSGPLLNETNWQYLGVHEEYTSVTKKVRRVGMFDSAQVREAVSRCRPTRLVLTFLDYITDELIKGYLLQLERSIGRQIDYISTGPGKIERR